MNDARATISPVVARHCPIPWTDEHRRTADEMAAMLREDIEKAGGLDRWIERGVAGDRCPVVVRRRRA
ncbi:MAG: hypothetical protein HY775_11420 [Acidobacteria bacterium]|nr:hypothetical protein [Acidobacteriota bacterium]